jgi:hypothetical protein
MCEPPTRVQTGGFGIGDPQYLDHNTGNVQALSVSSGPHTVTSNNGGFATATAYSLAELGALHGYGSIDASMAPGGLTAGADAQITGASWADTITVTSDTLPAATQVQLQATLTFHRTLSGTGSDTLVQTNATMSGPFNLSISDTLASPNPAQSVTTTMTAFVGFPFQVFGQLYFQINGGAYLGNSPISGDIDVSNTATFTLVSLNPAASYTTASGASYLPVPEPGSLALGALGVLYIGSRHGRRAAERSR